MLWSAGVEATLFRRLAIWLIISHARPFSGSDSDA